MVKFAVNIDSCSTLKKTRISLKIFVQNYDEITLANLYPKIFGRGGKELPITREWVKLTESMQKLFRFV